MKIIKDYERYEPVLMTEIMRMLFMYKKQDSIYRGSIRSVSGSKCTLKRFFIKYESGCFYPLESYSLQERTYIR